MEKRDLRIVFMGTPEFAVETLKALVENEYNVVAVVTQPDSVYGNAGVCGGDTEGTGRERV